MSEKDCITDRETILAQARQVFDIELEGIAKLRGLIGDDYVAFIQKAIEVLNAGGKLVMCGVGKSAHISRKIAATLASTGSRSVFMHPVEAMHGDLGMVSHLDMLVAVSYSGETDELLAVLPAVKRLELPIAAITASKESRLGKFADIVVEMPVPREACPFNLAPTTTTSALAVLGDSMAMTLLHCRKFGINDYARLHPAGAIGRSITLTVKDFMRKNDRAPQVRPESTVRDALLAMTAARSGAVAITESDGTLLGIFTDGDFRRAITADAGVLQAQIKTVMTQNPISINENRLAVEILKIIENRKIDDIVAVSDDGKFAGLVDIQDLPKFKVM